MSILLRLHELPGARHLPDGAGPGAGHAGLHRAGPVPGRGTHRPQGQDSLPSGLIRLGSLRGNLSSVS